MKKVFLVLSTVILASCAKDEDIILQSISDPVTISMELTNVKTKTTSLTGKSPDTPQVFNVFITGEGREYVFNGISEGVNDFELETRGNYQIIVTNAPEPVLPDITTEWYLYGEQSINTNYGSFDVQLKNLYYGLEFIDNNVYYNPYLDDEQFGINSDGNYYIFSKKNPVELIFETIDGRYYNEVREFEINSYNEFTVEISPNGNIEVDGNIWSELTTEEL